MTEWHASGKLLKISSEALSIEEEKDGKKTTKGWMMVPSVSGKIGQFKPGDLVTVTFVKETNDLLDLKPKGNGGSYSYKWSPGQKEWQEQQISIVFQSSIKPFTDLYVACLQAALGDVDKANEIYVRAEHRVVDSAGKYAKIVAHKSGLAEIDWKPMENAGGEA